MNQFKQILKKAHDKGLTPAASAHLDAIRSTAALAVLLMHARHLFLIDWAQVQGKNVLSRLAYAASDFGHQAVIVFFVLSGFLIGPSVLRSIHTQRWSPSRYFMRRFFRLEVVLFPALLLCVAWDLGGIHLFGLGGIYGGHETFYPVGYNIARRLSWPIFWGNAAFLQILRLPTLGSDSPLWSLSNEFWYYMLFPCIALLVSSFHQKRGRIFYGVLACLIGWFIGKDLLLYFPIWVIGTLIFYLPKWNVSGLLRVATLAISAVVFGCVTVMARFYWTNVLIADYCMSIAFAIFLYFLINNSPPSQRSVFQCLSRNGFLLLHPLCRAHSISRVYRSMDRRSLDSDPLAHGLRDSSRRRRLDLCPSDSHGVRGTHRPISLLDGAQIRNVGSIGDLSGGSTEHPQPDGRDTVVGTRF